MRTSDLRPLFPLAVLLGMLAGALGAAEVAPTPLLDPAKEGVERQFTATSDQVR